MANPRHNKKYDFVIVGAGFAGTCCARLLTDKGYKCLMLEERPFVSGNAVSMEHDGVDVHMFGMHVLHTNDREIWSFLNRFGRIRHFYPEIKIFNAGKLYTFPINYSTVRELHGSLWPTDSKKSIAEDIVKNDVITNVREYCLNKYGNKVYDTIYNPFLGKKFMEDPDGLRIENLYFRTKISYKNNYLLYPEKYQGIPDMGYKSFIETMIGDDIDIILNTDFTKDKDKFMSLAVHTIYTGELDRFFNYCIGSLSWQASNFTFENVQSSNATGFPMLYFADPNIPWISSTEHQWLGENKNAADRELNSITYEYPIKWEPGKDCTYPLITQKSIDLYNRYVKKLNASYPAVLLCGRRAKYTNWHICEVIRDAMNLTDKFPDISE